MERVLFFGMTAGEVFLVAFVVMAVVSAPWWPRLGERLFGGSSRDASSPANGPVDD